MNDFSTWMKYKYISVDGWSIQRSKGGDIITAIEEFYMEWIEDGNESKEGNNLSMDILLWILQVAQTKKRENMHLSSTPQV